MLSDMQGGGRGGWGKDVIENIFVKNHADNII